MINATPTEEILDLSFGEVLDGGISVLVGFNVRTGERSGMRDPIAIDEATLSQLNAALSGLLTDMAQEAKDLSKLPPAPADLPAWNDGPTLRDLKAGGYGGLSVCSGFALEAHDPEVGMAVAVISATSAIGPSVETFTGHYLISYNALKAISEALPKVLRKMVQKSVAAARAKH